MDINQAKLDGYFFQIADAAQKLKRCNVTNRSKDLSFMESYLKDIEDNINEIRLIIHD